MRDRHGFKVRTTTMYIEKVGNDYLFTMQDKETMKQMCVPVPIEQFESTKAKLDNSPLEQHAKPKHAKKEATTC